MALLKKKRLLADSLLPYAPAGPGPPANRATRESPGPLANLRSRGGPGTSVSQGGRREGEDEGGDHEG